MVTTTTNATTVSATIMCGSGTCDDWDWVCTVLLFAPLYPGLIALGILAYCEVFIK